MKKKFLLVGTLFASTLLLTACGNSDKGTKTSSVDKSSTSSQSSSKNKNSKEKQLNDVVQQNDKIQMTLNSVKQEKLSGDEEEYSNAEYNTKMNVKSPYFKTTVTYSIKNISSDVIDLGYGEQNVESSDGQMYSSESSSHAFYNNLDLVKLKPNSTIDGSFELLTKDKPADISQLTFNWDDLSIDSDTRVGDGTVNLTFDIK